MKKIFLFSLSCLFVFIVTAQGKLTKDQQKVQHTVVGMFQAMAERDSSKTKSYCTADIMILENGIAWNLDTLVLKISQPVAPDFKRINTIDFIATTVNENVAWTTYNNQADVTRNGKHVNIKWLETAILIKQDKIWRIKVLHSTLIKRGEVSKTANNKCISVMGA